MSEQTQQAVGFTIAQLIIYAFLIVNLYVIFTKTSFIAQTLACVSSFIFITVLVLFHKSKH